jgi:hypothetical protein
MSSGVPPQDPYPQQPPYWQQQPPQRRSPWGAVLAAVLALGIGFAGGYLVADNGESNVKTVTKAKTVTSQGSTDVTVSVPTTTTTVEKTVTVTTGADRTLSTTTP